MADQSIHPLIPAGEETVEFQLDGRTVTARKGESIIQVAAREGVYVPHYCWHPSLSVAGNCRLCLVEMHMPNPRDPGKLQKLPKPVIGCQTPVAPGSAVFTQSELAKSCQNGMMEFLLVNHPLDCPICDRGGECMLQRYSMEYGGGHSRMLDKKRKFRKPQFDPLIDIERNRCIMCTRCVRFCDEVAGEHVMGVFDRGAANYIGTFGLGPVSNIFSGNVIDLCPVGCLTSKPFRFRARVWELTQTQSTGVLDASGPKVTHWTRNGRLYRTTPPSRKYHDTYTVNEDTQEFIDNLHRFGSDFGKHPSRWDEARVRMGANLLPAAWGEAVRGAAAGLARVKANHGADSLAVLVSPRATNEEAYLAARFARTTLGTDSVDWRSGARSTSAAQAIDLAFEYAGGDLEEKFDALFLLSGDHQHTTPTLALHLKEWARIMGRPVVMFGHHHDAYFAEHAELLFSVGPGETAAALRMLWSILMATGAQDAMKAELADMTASTPAQVDRLIEILRGAKRGLVVQNLDDMNGTFLAHEVPAAVATTQAAGLGWRYLPITKARNAIGMNVLGVQPGLLPADQPAMLRHWGVKELRNTGGVSAPELLDAIEAGHVKGLLCLGADALFDYADDARVLAALEKLEYFAVSDLFESEFTKRADAFFPAASNLERDGTYLDIQGNIARLTAAEGPSGASKPDWELVAALGRAMGDEGYAKYRSAADVFADWIRVAAPRFRGTFDGLRLAGPANDITIADPGGARRLSPDYNPGDFRQDGAHFRGTSQELLALQHEPPAPEVAGHGAYLLAYGAHVQGEDYHLNRASIAGLLKVAPYVEINEADAKTIGVENNGRVAITLPGGCSVEATARVKAHGPAKGVLWMPSNTAALDIRREQRVLRVEAVVLEAAPAEPEFAGAAH
ncbi:MAG: molybdopterin-dependent oxidoreductase [Candidatus Sumerlaeia bacterium]|nr:molybdopterin-dependent oxidoreductase [Candidatus Sumerlaeia bacterium]